MAELPADPEQTKALLVCAKNRTNDPLLREKLLSALEVIEAFHGQIVERDLLRKILKEG